MMSRRSFFSAKADYEAVARILQDSLILVRDEGTHVFLGFAAVLRTRLLVGERKWIAWTALVSLDAEHARDVIERVLRAEGSAGPPQVPFLDIQVEANAWAAWATAQELWAYALASATRLSPTKRQLLWRALRSAAQHGK